MIPLTDLKEKEKAKIINLEGGRGFINKLEGLGIRSGTIIEKKSSQFMRGPVCIKIGNTEIALGYGMAKKIIVKKQ